MLTFTTDPILRGAQDDSPCHLAHVLPNLKTMRRVTIATVVTALLLPAGAEQARAVQRLIDVRQIATDTLRDVALARFENGRPVIYYNPTLLQQLGPSLTTFFFAHEYGHIRYGHTGAALLAAEGDLTAVRQRQELEADCYAARSLAESAPESVRAAVLFFTREGPFRFDAWHPSGSQRAAKILACLPDTSDAPARNPEDPTFSSDSSGSSHIPVARPESAASSPGAPPI